MHYKLVENGSLNCVDCVGPVSKFAHRYIAFRQMKTYICINSTMLLTYRGEYREGVEKRLSKVPLVLWNFALGAGTFHRLIDIVRRIRSTILRIFEHILGYLLNETLLKSRDLLFSKSRPIFTIQNVQVFRHLPYAIHRFFSVVAIRLQKIQRRLL